MKMFDATGPEWSTEFERKKSLPCCNHLRTFSSKAYTYLPQRKFVRILHRQHKTATAGGWPLLSRGTQEIKTPTSTFDPTACIVILAGKGNVWMRGGKHGTMRELRGLDAATLV